MRIADTLCDGTGRGVNEDAIGWVGDEHAGAAWVVDGATGVAGRSFVPGGGSDARWYAQTLSAALAGASTGYDEPPPQLFRSAIDHLAGRWTRVALPPAGDGGIPPYARPSAAAAWVRWQDGQRLEFAALGDCRALLKPVGEPVRALGRTSADASDDLVNAAVRRLQAAGISDPEELWRHLEGPLRQARARLNQPGGYWAFSIEPAAADHLDLETVRLDRPAALLLLSDGFYRLVDTYAALTREELMEAALDQGLAPLYRQLRQIEDQDPQARRFPRLKPKDDASAVLLIH